MSTEAVALARLRQELRERLMTGRVGGAWEILAAFRRCVEQVGQDPELIAEYRRWTMRFDLLSPELLSSAA